MYLYYTSITIILFLFLVIMFIQTNYNSHMTREDRKYFTWVYVVLSLGLMSDWACAGMEETQISVTLHKLAISFSMSVTPAIPVLLSFLTGRKRSAKAAIALLGINAAFVFSSLFWSMPFDITRDNRMITGKLYFIYLLFCVASVVYLFVSFYKFSIGFRKRNRAVLVCIYCLYVTGVMMQTIDSSIHLSYLSLSILTMLFYFYYSGFRQQQMDDRMKKQTRIIDTLSADYESVYLLNTEMDRITTLRLSEKIKKNFGENFGTGMTFEQAMELYVANTVVPEDREEMLEICSFANVRNVLENVSVYEYDYRIIKGESTGYCQMKAARAGESEIVFGFADITERMEQQIILNERLSESAEAERRQHAVLVSLSKIYLSMHILNLKKDTITPIKSTEAIDGILGGNKSAVAGINAVMNRLATDEYREKILEFVDLYTVQERMKGSAHIACEFIGILNGWCKAMFVANEYDSSGNLESVIFTVRIIEQEKKKEEHLQRISSTDALTGLRNRYAYEKADNELKENGISETAIITADLNSLKVINDTLGHAAGDEAIMGAGRCIENVFGRKGKCFRMGGDEFNVIISVPEAELKKLTDEFDKAIEGWTGELVKHISVSYGYAYLTEFSENHAENAERTADRRMYDNKEKYYREHGGDSRKVILERIKADADGTDRT